MTPDEKSRENQGAEANEALLKAMIPQSEGSEPTDSPQKAVKAVDPCQIMEGRLFVRVRFGTRQTTRANLTRGADTGIRIRQEGSEVEILVDNVSCWRGMAVLEDRNIRIRIVEDLSKRKEMASPEASHKLGLARLSGDEPLETECRRPGVVFGQEAESLPYDFHHQPRLSIRQIRFLETIHEAMLRRWEANLSSYLDTAVETSLMSVEQCRIQDFASILSNPACLNILDCSPLAHAAILALDPSVAFTALERRLGCGHTHGYIPGRGLNDMEWEIIRPVITDIAEALRECWMTVADMDFKVLGQESDPILLQPGSCSQMIAYVSAEVRIGENVGLLNLAYPWFMLRHVNAHCQNVAVYTAAEKAEGEQISLADLPVDLSIEAKGTMSLATATALAPGVEMELLDVDLAACINGFPAFTVVQEADGAILLGEKLACAKRITQGMRLTTPKAHPVFDRTKPKATGMKGMTTIHIPEEDDELFDQLNMARLKAVTLLDVSFDTGAQVLQSWLSRGQGRFHGAHLLLSLPEKVASALVSSLDMDIASGLCDTIASLGIPSPKIALEALREYTYRIRLSRILRNGGQEAASSVFSTALARRPPVWEDVSIDGDDPLAELRDLDAESLLGLCKNEHHQTIAVLLASLEASAAACILGRMPMKQKMEIAYRISTMKPIASKALWTTKKAMLHPTSFVPFAFYRKKRVLLGGPRKMGRILNQMTRQAQKCILENLGKNDASLAGKVRDSMFQFNDILHITDKSIQAILKEVNDVDLALALKTASEALLQRFFINMSDRAAAALKENIEFLGPVRIGNVKEAQRSIVGIIRRLDDAGEMLVLRGGGDESVVA